MSRPHLLTRRQVTGAALASAGLIAAGPAKALETLTPTADSPMGPFYPVNRLAENDADLTRLAGHSGRALGSVIEVTGRVLDLRGNPIPGAALELWQCNAAGRYAHDNDVSTAPLDPNFQGYAALRTDAAGEWRIVTVKPGGYNSPIGHRPPHLHWDLMGRRDRRILQMYFPEEAEANAADQLYRALGEAAASSVARQDGIGHYRWDIVLAEG